MVLRQFNQILFLFSTPCELTISFFFNLRRFFIQKDERIFQLISLSVILKIEVKCIKQLDNINFYLRIFPFSLIWREHHFSVKIHLDWIQVRSL